MLWAFAWALNLLQERGHEFISVLASAPLIALAVCAEQDAPLGAATLRGQRDDEVGAAVHLALNADRAAALGDDFVADGEAEPNALRILVLLVL